MSLLPAVRPFRSITRDILRRVSTIAAISVLLVAATQTWLQYRTEVARVHQLVTTVTNSHVPLLTVAIWDIEPKVLTRQIDMIARHPEIRTVELSTLTGQTVSAGEDVVAMVPDLVVPIPHPRTEGATLGELALSYDRQQLQHNILMSVVVATAKFVAFILVVCAVVYRVMVFRLNRPLRQIAEYSQQLSPDRDNPPLVIRRPERQWRDEIDLVLEGFETLREAIARYSSERDKVTAELARERDQLEQRVEERTRELEDNRRELFLLSRTDHLTGLANRRYFDEAKGIEERRARRSGLPISLIMIDVDYFKAYNDRYGHAHGDECLVQLATIMKDHCRRAGDLAVRLGGEEFAMLLPGQDAASARDLAERLRQSLLDARLPHEGSPLGQVSVSIGCATWQPGVSLPVGGELFDRLLSLADKRLYQAKHSGRNQVVAADAEHDAEVQENASQSGS
ncbi:GGDEF domain-containing protein [Marinobacter xestospongiae]|uniref:diguanylate cyclase n=1 Tax=Marinobacter xestospongiae TaxID=994319 RepID=A0ABU3VSN5_9GAMM|nr:diguanylate cyclase [Marinobacter xestospongiae]MDV2077180.1 diguanylate cyclase [Marinobacter xestospongiae]